MRPTTTKTTSSIKLCINCTHYKRDIPLEYGYRPATKDWCYYKQNTAEYKIDLVRGAKLYDLNTKPVSCIIARNSFCGVEAKYFSKNTAKAINNFLNKYGIVFISLTILLIVALI